MPIIVSQSNCIDRLFMIPALILSGFPKELDEEISRLCEADFCGISSVVLTTTTELDAYLSWKSPFQDRGGPTGMVIFSWWGREDASPKNWKQLKEQLPLKKVPVVLMADQHSRERVLALRSWPLAAILEVDGNSDSFGDQMIFYIRYWTEIVQLPMV